LTVFEADASEAAGPLQKVSPDEKILPNGAIADLGAPDAIADLGAPGAIADQGDAFKALQPLPAVSQHKKMTISGFTACGIDKQVHTWFAPELLQQVSQYHQTTPCGSLGCAIVYGDTHQGLDKDIKHTSFMSFTQFTAMPVMLTYCTRLVGAKITETASEDQHAEQEGAAEDQTADKETPEKPVCCAIIVLLTHPQMKVMVTVALNTWLPLGTSDLCANSGLSTESTCSGGESIRAMVVDVINGPSQGQGVTTGLNVDPALDQGNRTRWVCVFRCPP